MKYLTRSLASLSALSVLLFTPTVLAVDVFNDVCDGAKDATVCKEVDSQQKSDDNPIFGPEGIVTFLVNLLSGIVGIAAVIMIILGGFKMVTSGSNPQDVNNAREMVIYAVAGLIVAVSAQMIVRVFLNKIGAS